MALKHLISTHEKQLYASRLDLSAQMQRVLACKSSQDKRDLVAAWRKTYTERMVAELLGCARDKRVCQNIANWIEDERI